MPKEDPLHRSPDDFDPEQTLFFQRRKRSVNLLPIIVGAILLLGSGVLLVWAFSAPDKHATDRTQAAAVDDRPLTPHSAATPGQIPPPQPEIRRAQPVGTPQNFDDSKPVRAALPLGTPPPGQAAADADGDAPPAMPDANAPLNFNVQDPANAQVRTEVLRRIDLMPKVSDANKDKLYASVDHARGMGRVLTIPFVKGEMGVRPADVDRLKGQLASPALQPIVDDPTAVFVVLGYADPKGSDKVNADLSLSRARAVLDTLRDKCGVQNVMHAVAMGGSTLFSTQQVEKNRVVEVWAVLP